MCIRDSLFIMSMASDWLARLQEYANSPHEQFDLTTLKPGDVLRVNTRNTLYTFRILEERMALMETNRENRPIGRVKIMGCTFGLSSTISPNHLFCGGNLELSLLEQEVRMTHTTSAIRAIEWLRREPAAA